MKIASDGKCFGCEQKKIHWLLNDFQSINAPITIRCVYTATKKQWQVSSHRYAEWVEWLDDKSDIICHDWWIRIGGYLHIHKLLAKWCSHYGLPFERSEMDLHETAINYLDEKRDIIQVSKTPSNMKKLRCKKNESHLMITFTLVERFSESSKKRILSFFFFF